MYFSQPTPVTIITNVLFYLPVVHEGRTSTYQMDANWVTNSATHKADDLTASWPDMGLPGVIP